MNNVVIFALFAEYFLSDEACRCHVLSIPEILLESFNVLVALSSLKLVLVKTLANVCFSSCAFSTVHIFGFLERKTAYSD